jgi:hypothetical protein
MNSQSRLRTTAFSNLLLNNVSNKLYVLLYSDSSVPKKRALKVLWHEFVSSLNVNFDNDF